MVLIIGVVVYFLLFFIAFFVAAWGYSDLNKEVDTLKGKLALFQKEAQESKNGQMSMEGELTRLKDELGNKREELAEKIREKDVLALELSRIKSMQVDESVRIAEMSIKDKEIKRLKSELEYALGSSQETERLKESLRAATLELEEYKKKIDPLTTG